MLAALDSLLERVGAVVDLALHVAVLDCRHHAAQVVDARDVGQGLLFQPVGEALDAVGPSQRVDRLRNAGLQGDHLLGAQRESGGLLARQRQGFV